MIIKQDFFTLAQLYTKGVEMKTEFKIFDSDWGVYTLEDVIKEYQEKHNAEIKNIMLIKSNYDKTIIGVVFEKEDKK